MMVRANNKLVISTLLCCSTFLLLHLIQCQGSKIDGLGVNWGSLASHPLYPPIVVNMLKDNGINKVKLFDSDSWTVGFFAGTGIEVMVGIPNDQLSRFAGSFDEAEDWVKQNVSKHMYDGGVNIKYVAVGNEPFLKSYNGSFLKSTFPAMKNIQKAIEKAGLGDKIKVSVPLNADVYDSPSNKPSDGDFRGDIHDLMLDIVRFLNEKDSPFMVNIYPFLSLYQSSDFPRELAFFDGGRSIDDDNAHYDNAFDANFDTLVSSLKKNGFPNTKIVVGEVGWPTDGATNANNNNAKRFYQGLMKKLASKKGTPLHPHALQIYLFSLLDEDLKSIDPGNFERHWGIFRYDGVAKFPVDFTGQGQDKMPVSAKGVLYQEKKWCALKKDVDDKLKIGNAVSYACQGADCTSIAGNSSCGNVDLTTRASYAFNQYFQVRDQSMDVCDFDGIAEVVTQEPSKKCFFRLEIQSDGNVIKATRTLLIAFMVLVFTALVQ